MNNQITRHHLYPTSRGGRNVPENVSKITRKYHDRIHCLFENKTPVEQLETVVKDNAKCLTKDFIDAIRHILSNEGKWHYKD
jgi:hypothetical protein